MKKNMTTKSRGDERRIWLFILCEKKQKCLLLLNGNRIVPVQCRQQETSQRFCETLLKYRFVGHNYVLKMQRNELKYGFLPSKPCLFSSNIQMYFEFLINTALPASNSVYRQNFMGKNAKHN